MADKRGGRAAGAPAAGASPADAVLAAAGATPGARVRLTAEGRTYEGVLMPSHAFSRPDVAVVKLDNGYNVGIGLSAATKVEVIGRPAAPRTLPALPARSEGLPDVALLGTGGTIASFVEYRTGAVYPATTPEELAAAVPEAFQVANLRPEVVFQVFSEDMTPGQWEQLAARVVAAFDGGARGVVVGHGTDTMHVTAAALSFALRDLPGPVVLVGAQRSSDRPSSDAASNLVAAARVAAEAGLGEVVVVMHAGTGDDAWAVHRGTRVRKMHTSRRDAFRTINGPPLGMVTDAGIMLGPDARPRAAGPARVEGRFAGDVGLLHSYPGLTESQLDAAAGAGLVLAGTGLGHIPRRLVPAIERLTKRGCVVAMTSQCLWGRVNMKVYSTGRDLLAAGVLDAGDMLPETAYAKLAWACGTGRDGAEAARLFAAPAAGETQPRTPFDFVEADGR